MTNIGLAFGLAWLVVIGGLIYFAISVERIKLPERRVRAETGGSMTIDDRTALEIIADYGFEVAGSDGTNVTVYIGEYHARKIIELLEKAN
jgi:hypothetical protein